MYVYSKSQSYVYSILLVSNSMHSAFVQINSYRDAAERHATILAVYIVFKMDDSGVTRVYDSGFNTPAPYLLL